MQAFDGREIVVDRVGVVLLGPRQARLGFGQLSGRGVALPRPGHHQPVGLARLLHGWTGAIDALACKDQLAVGLVDLESDGVRDRIRLGHGLANARIGDVQFGHPLASLKQAPLQLDEAQGQVGMAARAGLLEVEEGTIGHNAWGEIGAGDTRPYLGRLDRLTGHLKLATADRRLQTVGQAKVEGGDVGRVHDASDRAGVQADGQVEGRDGDRFCLLGDIQSPLGLRQRNLRARPSRVR